MSVPEIFVTEQVDSNCKCKGNLLLTRNDQSIESISLDRFFALI